MIVGVLQFDLWIHDAAGLKDKRRVVRSVRDRLHREHRVGVAEVGSQDTWNRAEMALSAVGTDTRRVAGVFDAVTRKLRERTDCELGSTRRWFSRVDQMAEMAESGEGDSEAMAGVTAELLALADAGLLEPEVSGGDGTGCDSGASADGRRSG
jgi:hypothetical protein